MDIACLPSYREGLPKMPLEAAAMELPVVVTDVPGCIDSIVAGETGMLVPAADFLALVQALKAYLVDADMRRRHGRAGRAWVMRAFRPEQIQHAMLQEYRRLMELTQGSKALSVQRNADESRSARKAA
jgi:glycosyltransferase involved in cell wall biosynthesis